MVAASAARNGHTVLHVDVNDYYGGLWSAFNFDGMQKWIELNGKYEDAKCNDKDNEISIESNANAAQDEQNIDSLLKDGEILVKFNPDNCIRDVHQEWHFDQKSVETNENQNIDSISTPKEENMAEKDTSPTLKEDFTNKKPRYPWTKDKIINASRHFNLDLVPRLLYARGAMVDLLISSNISRYTEFKVSLLLGSGLEDDLTEDKYISCLSKFH